ncbi:MAG TPA: efflux RND transporter periplasmic adaptor subunit [Pirellulales bacterium]|jgi:RND family efflux transporter MFP subunit|nr:efflux RND transporter periplasmic adaptor subunit [Pirellulales bacterium]
MKTLVWPFVLAAVLGCAGLGECRAQGKADAPTDKTAPPVVEVCHPLVRDVTNYVDLLGTTEPAASVVLRPRVSSAITRINFQAGDQVKTGQVLFDLDARLQQAEAEKSQAQLVAAEAHIARLERERERLKALAANAAVSHEDLDKATGALDEAKGELQVARASLTVARVNLEFTKVVSPVDGTISRPALSVGNIVKADETELARVEKLHPLSISFEVDERTYLQLRRAALKSGNTMLGAPIEIRFADDSPTEKPRTGAVSEIGNRIDPDKGTVVWRATLANEQQDLLPGMFTRIRLTTGTTNGALLIPPSCLVEQVAGEPLVFKVKEDAIKATPVKLGALHDGLREVTEGIEKTDLLVIDGDSAKAFAAGKIKPKLVVVKGAKADARGK